MVMFMIVGLGPVHADDTLSINEFMADSDGNIEDPDEPGAYEDWIELYNSGPTAFDLGGTFLTDDLADPTKWQIPAGVTIAAGGYLFDNPAPPHSPVYWHSQRGFVDEPGTAGSHPRYKPDLVAPGTVSVHSIAFPWRRPSEPSFSRLRCILRSDKRASAGFAESLVSDV